MNTMTTKDNQDSNATVAMAEKGDLAKSDHAPWKDRKRPTVSQAGRYKRFDKSIPNGAERVIEPSKYDVVFGRGKGSHDHPGNKRMREIIRRHKKDYAAIHRSKKRQIAELVYSEITQDGARFLHKIKDEDAYAVVDLSLALQKLSNTLRCRKSCLIDDDESQDESFSARSASIATKPNLALSASSIGAASAAGIQALRGHQLAAGLPHAGLIPPAGLGLSAMHPLEASGAVPVDPLLRHRYLRTLAAARADLLLPPTSLAERELLLRRSAALPPLGGSPLLRRSLLASDPYLPSVPSLPQSEKISELVRAEQEYLLARTRLRAAALGI